MTADLSPAALEALQAALTDALSAMRETTSRVNDPGLRRSFGTRRTAAMNSVIQAAETIKALADERALLVDATLSHRSMASRARADWRVAQAKIDAVRTWAKEQGAPAPYPVEPFTFDKGVRAAATDVLVILSADSVTHPENETPRAMFDRMTEEVRAASHETDRPSRTGVIAAHPETEPTYDYAIGRTQTGTIQFENVNMADSEQAAIRWAAAAARPEADLRPTAQRLAEATGIGYADAERMLATARPEAQTPTREALAQIIYTSRGGYGQLTSEHPHPDAHVSIAHSIASGEARRDADALLASDVLDGRSGTAVTLHTYTDKQLDQIRAETMGEAAEIAESYPGSAMAREVASIQRRRAAEYRKATGA